MTIDLTEIEVEFLRAAMRAAIEQAKVAPYKEAVEVLPVFESIAAKLAAQ